MMPLLERVPVPADQIDNALRRLEQEGTLPDGTVVVDRLAMCSFRRQINKGCFFRLTFPPETTKEQVLDWYRDAATILNWYRGGLL